MSRDVGEKRFSAGRVTLHLGLLTGAVLSLFPLYWLLVMSTRTSSDIFRFPPKLVPGTELLNNIDKVLDSIPFFQSFFNSLFIAVSHTLLVLFFCSLAGFAFAKFEFPGRNLLFVFLLATMMVPNQLGLVPSFIIMTKLGWVNSFKALIIPNAANAFGIFWMRQYISTAIHDDLLHAGRIDGCNNFQLYWRVVLPIVRPALATLALITFLQSWNDYMWPLVILSDQAKYTLMVAITSLNGVYTNDYSIIMAATLMATVPLIIVFSFFSRQFISGLMAGSIKD